MRFAYADPPYPGMAHLYKDHPDYAGEVDHQKLIERLVEEFPDGWALSTGMRDLREIIGLCPPTVRTLAWIKTDSMPQDFRPELMWTWEPVLLVGGRRKSEYVRDSLICSKAGIKLIGAKPDLFCFWLFRCLGALPGDDLVDLFPGSGAVGRAWDKFQRQMTLPTITEKGKQTRFEEEARETAHLAAT